MTVKRKQAKYLTPKEWAQAKALWESGSLTLEEMAAKFGVRRETLSRRFKKAGLVKGSKADRHAEKVHDDLAKRLSQDNVQISERIKETRENNYQWIAGLQRMTMQAVAKAKKDDMAMSTIYNDLKSYEKAIQIMRVGRTELWTVLGLDKDEIPDFADMPDLPITELSATEIDELKKKSFDLSMGIGEDEEDMLIGHLDDVDDSGIVEEG
tara:strand:- start:48384 stop:49013 length:630 start_codon:yes stop_codon:yes gene_type:complete